MVVLLKFLVGLVYVSGGVFELNLLYIEGFNYYECLGKEPWMLRGFRVGSVKEKSRAACMKQVCVADLFPL